MPRTFTHADLFTVTLADYHAMSQPDRDAYDRALWHAMCDAYDAGVTQANAKDRAEGDTYA